MDSQSWIIGLVSRIHCHRCHRPLSERSLLGVGMVIAEPDPDAPSHPVGQVEVGCEHCGHKLTVQVQASAEDVSEAVRLLEAHGREWRTRNHGQVEAADDRGVQALGPWEEAEVQTFLRQLKRLSFRRSTKSFREWMRRMGNDQEP